MKVKYSSQHEWVKAEGQSATIGITDYAQDQLGDVVYVELPPVGQEFSAGQEAGVVESVKTVSSVYCPVSGKVVEVNEALKNNSQWVNEDPGGKGWMFKVEMSHPADLDKLLSDEEYQTLIKAK